MLFHDLFEVPEWASLTFIALSLLIGIVVSLQLNKGEDSANSN
jgi:tellurite resistance protein TerC